MRKDIVVNVSAADRARLEAIVADRNTPQKHVWRTQIILSFSRYVYPRVKSSSCGRSQIASAKTSAAGPL